MKLCKHCIKRNNLKQNPVNPEKCEICKGFIDRLDEMLKKIKIKDSYSISTHIPKDWEIREETLWRSPMACIKTDINQKIIKYIGKKYDPINGKWKVEINAVKNEINVSLNNIYLFGRYLKTKPNICQSRWYDKEGKKRYESIEEIIGERIIKHTGGQFILHASGREDIDVLNIAGRPFVIEIKKPKKIEKIEILEKEINLNPYGVKIKDLKYVKRSMVEIVSSSHFDKTYIAEVELDSDNINLEKIYSLKGKIIKQRTPNRVKHRRADRIRKRKILDIKIIKKNPLTIEITAEAGTYIKELISGDEGRTMPSISKILKCNAKCKKLIVKNIKDDFLNTLKGEYV